MVDDDQQRRGLLREKLVAMGYRVLGAGNAADAMAMVRDFSPQIILLNATLSGADGVETCRMLQENGHTEDIPVILLADAAGRIDKTKGLRAGALDFLAIPADDAELEARVANAVRLKLLADKLRDPAAEDALTGLLNRASFMEQFQRECNRSRRYDSLFALVIMDIDGFNEINERFGLSFGDHVLKEVAAVLREQTRQSDSLARWGGNEFIVMLPEADLPKAIGFAKKLHSALGEHTFTFQQETLHVSVSIGVASRQNIGGRDPSEMLRLAHGCLNTVKEASGGTIAYHTCWEYSLVRQ
jgi:diguanylate cyclase (GGDEF)-like protein